jgi:hypothetical protein
MNYFITLIDILQVENYNPPPVRFASLPAFTHSQAYSPG